MILVTTLTLCEFIRISQQGLEHGLEKIFFEELVSDWLENICTAIDNVLIWTNSTAKDQFCKPPQDF